MAVKIHHSWQKVLTPTFEQNYFQSLIAFVKEEYQKFPENVFPKKSQIFRAFDACHFDHLKVVILGQDPYPTKGHAHGLCFSCDANVRPLPKSLQNIFKELEDDLGMKAPTDGDLNFWAEQGILLLNAILTVREGHPLSHAHKGWEQFTDDVIQVINQHKTGVVFILWGAPAQKKGSIIDETKHFVLRAPHPSPLSAYRGFFGSKPFSKVNEVLKKMGKGEVAWAR